MKFASKPGNHSRSPSFPSLASIDHSANVPIQPHQFGIDRIITDLTNGTTFFNASVADPTVASSYGGTQIGWRVRASSNAAAPEFSNLAISGS